MTRKSKDPREWLLGRSGAALLAEVQELREDKARLSVYLLRQWDWSKRTFGDGLLTLGVTRHIEKEIAEIRANPTDLSEWVDVIILAMDGYWRHGGKPERLLTDMQEKQDKNFARTWPAPTSEDEAVEHDRSSERAAIDAARRK